MRIAVVGANGQVAAEVTLILKQLGLDVVPISRSRKGAAYLRYMGLPVRIGSVSDPDQCERLFGDADVIANFALASGTPAEMMVTHDRIIENTFRYSPAGARLVFFSTVSVHGEYSLAKKAHIVTAYGREKLRNERKMRRLEASSGRSALVLRLGHVFGELQGITDMVRAQIASGLVYLPEPARHANITYTATIADALAGVGDGRLPASGTYDLYNQPPWTWAQAFAYEAGRIGSPLTIETVGQPTSLKTSLAGDLLNGLRAAFANPLVKEVGRQVLTRLSPQINARMRALYLAQRARTEAALIETDQPTPMIATYWRGLEAHNPPGLKATIALLDDAAYRAPSAPIGPSWPQG